MSETDVPDGSSEQDESEDVPIEEQKAKVDRDNMLSAIEWLKKNFIDITDNIN